MGRPVIQGRALFARPHPSPFLIVAGAGCLLTPVVDHHELDRPAIDLMRGPFFVCGFGQFVSWKNRPVFHDIAGFPSFPAIYCD